MIEIINQDVLAAVSGGFSSEGTLGSAQLSSAERRAQRRAERDAERAEREAQRQARSTSGRRRGFPASAALGLPDNAGIGPS